MIERRLLLAKRLLNPANSVLIVTIDEKEYLRLGVLLEQVFSGARIQMISTLINPAAVARAGYFGRSDEYHLFPTSHHRFASPDKKGGGYRAGHAFTRHALILQFFFVRLPQTLAAVAPLGDALMVPAPVRPSDDVDREVGWRPAEPDEEPAEFGHGERNVPGADTSPWFVVPIANTVSASSARVMCRYQPR